MLTYVYKCDNCEDILEVKQRITEDPLLTCFVCGKDALKRQIQEPKFLLKGVDWHGTAHTNGKTRRFGAHKPNETD